MRTCSKCKNSLVETDFYKNEAACKKCRSEIKYEQRRAKRIKNNLEVKFPTLASRMLLEEGFKYCPGCKEILSVDYFSTTRVENKIASLCRECSNRAARKRGLLEENKIKRHKEYKRNREKTLDRKFRTKFGITLEDYNNLLESQQDKCAICSRTTKDNKKMLAVDHCHKTNLVRALLCSSCNICIGFIEKNKLNIDDIKNYLGRYEVF